MTLRFADRRVLITGAAGGLGRALALGFAREGARLILTDVEESGLAQTATLVGPALGSAHRVDLAIEREIRDLGAEIVRTQPRLDVLINNAGIAYGQINYGFADLTQEQWLRFLAINSVAPLLLAQAVRPALAAAAGVILNQSSMASFMPGTAYGITKATLNAMTYGMARAFAADGIRVNAIAPGLMETAAGQAALPPETLAGVRSTQLLRQHGSPEDVVALALFLASDAARFIDATIVNCDAGSSIRGWRQ